MVKDQEEIQKYLPVEEMEAGTYPDRNFFWGIASTILPDWAKT